MKLNEAKKINIGDEVVLNLMDENSNINIIAKVVNVSNRSNSLFFDVIDDLGHFYSEISYLEIK